MELGTQNSRVTKGQAHERRENAIQKSAREKAGFEGTAEERLTFRGEILSRHECEGRTRRAVAFAARLVRNQKKKKRGLYSQMTKKDYEERYEKRPSSLKIGSGF